MTIASQSDYTWYWISSRLCIRLLFHLLRFGEPTGSYCCRFGVTTKTNNTSCSMFVIRSAKFPSKTPRGTFLIPLLGSMLFQNNTLLKRHCCFCKKRPISNGIAVFELIFLKNNTSNALLVNLLIFDYILCIGHIPAPSFTFIFTLAHLSLTRLSFPLRRSSPTRTILSLLRNCPFPKKNTNISRMKANTCNHKTCHGNEPSNWMKLKKQKMSINRANNSKQQQRQGQNTQRQQCSETESPKSNKYQKCAGKQLKRNTVREWNQTNPNKRYSEHEPQN